MQLKLIRVLDNRDCIEDGRARYNLYNSEGGLYALKGTRMPSKIQCMDFYVDRNDMPEDDSHSDRHLSRQNGETAAGSGSETKLEEMVPAPTIDLYKKAMEEMVTVFCEKPKPEQIVKCFEDVIEKTFPLDSSDLYLCNKAFLSFDQGTARHSFSVYCLFCDIMFYIRSQEKDDEFYSLFKQKGLGVNFSSGQIRKYALGALLHDIGKIKLPARILENPNPLSPEEALELRKHVVYGIEILDEIGETSSEMRQMIGNHHPEYPFFTDTANSPLVQILSIADIFDACRTARPYKEAMPFDECIAILKRDRRQYGWSPYLLDKIIEGTLKKFELRYQILTKTLSF